MAGIKIYTNNKILRTHIIFHKMKLSFNINFSLINNPRKSNFANKISNRSYSSSSSSSSSSTRCKISKNKNYKKKSTRKRKANMFNNKV